MTSRAERPDPLYWTVAVFLFVWALAYGGLVYLSFATSSPDHLAELVKREIIKETYADYIAHIPNWVRGLSVFLVAMRLMGAIGLLLQRLWAAPAYAIALLATLVIMYRGFFIADAASVIRTSQIFVEVGFVAVSIFAVWFAYKSRRAFGAH